MAGVIVVVIAWVLNYPLAKWNISVSRFLSLRSSIKGLLNSAESVDHKVFLEGKG